MYVCVCECVCVCVSVCECDVILKEWVCVCVYTSASECVWLMLAVLYILIIDIHIRIITWKSYSAHNTRNIQRL